jgi:hypothetical protein
MGGARKMVVTRGLAGKLIVRGAGHESDTDTEHVSILPASRLVDWPRNIGNASCDRG